MAVDRFNFSSSMSVWSSVATRGGRPLHGSSSRSVRQCNDTFGLTDRVTVPRAGSAEMRGGPLTLSRLRYTLVSVSGVSPSVPPVSF